MISGRPHGNGRALFFDAVARIDKNQLGLKAGGMLFVHLRKGRNDDEIAHSGAARRGTIDRDDVAAAFAREWRT